MTTVRFADAEPLCKAWALTTSVAALVTRPDTGVSIYLSMPSSAPVPALVITRVGGAPRARADLPQDAARMQFDCWGKSRAQAAAICHALISELDSLARAGGFSDGDARLAAAEVISMLWLPDPQSDTPRYVVIAVVTTLNA